MRKLLSFGRRTKPAPGSSARGTFAARPRVLALESRVNPATLLGFSGNSLLTFSDATPGSATSVAVTGLASGETILDADVNPATGQLVALGSSSRLYTINTTTGAATAIGTAGQFSLTGTGFGIDFNPVSGAVQIVGSADQNLTVNATTGALISTGPTLAFAAGDVNAGANPNVVAVAFTNSVSGATSTTFYGIDTNLNALVTGNLATGQLTTVGPLGVDVTSAASFDILPGATTGLAVLSVNGTSSGLYSINLTTGQATLIGTVGAGSTLVTGLAVAPTGTGGGTVTSTVSGNAVTITGTEGADAITLDASGGFLRHDLFDQGVTGFASAFDFDTTQAGEQKVAVSNSLSVTVNALGGNDTITIGSDSASVTSSKIDVTVNGGAGTDEVVVDSSAAASTNATTVYHISGSEVRVSSGIDVSLSGVEEADITGGPGKDKFIVKPDATLAVTVHGGPPNGGWPADSLVVSRGGTTGADLTSTESASGISGTWEFNGLQTITFDGIEKLQPESRVVVGAGAGGSPHVRVFDPETMTELFNFFAFGGDFRGGVNVATGDVNADGVADFVVAAAGNGGPHVKVFDGETGGLIREFFAFDGGFRGGVNLAVGDVNNDGFADIVVAARSEGGPHVKVFSGEDGSLIREFFAFDASFHGGVNIAVGDVNDDGFADIVVAAGPGGGPHVRVFSGADGSVIREFFAFGPGFGGGVTVAVGDFDNDGDVDIVTGAASRGGPHVRVFSGADGTLLDDFFAFPGGFRGGVRLAVTDVNADGVPDIVVGQGGSGGGGRLRMFSGLDLSLIGNEMSPFGEFLGGVFVGGM